MPNQTKLFPQFDAENAQLEFKSGENGILPENVWKTISAFANTEGGQLVLGINPDQTPVGLSPTQQDKLQRDVLSLCQGGFSTPIIPDIQTLGQTVVVFIPPSPAQLRPVYSSSRGPSKGTYLRIGASNTRATADDLQRLYVAARGGAESIEFTDLDYKEAFDFDSIADYVGLVNKSRNNAYRDMPVESVLQKIRALSQKNDPTLFGILVFGKGLVLQEQTAPTTNIAVTQYATESKVDPTDPGITFIDDREFNGNVIKQYEEAWLFIRSKLPVKGVVDSSGKRQEYLSIPEKALREALANALTHRDYATYSSRVQVDIYSNRIEITNPGTSLVPIESLDNTPSISRNPNLMSFLKDFHITEQRARGIRTIRDSLREAGLPEPKFENMATTSFRITLYNSAFMPSEDHEWLKQFKRFGLNERQLVGLTHLHSSPTGLSNKEYRRINSMHSIGDDRRANYELNRLVEKGLVVHNNAIRNRRYYLNEL